MGIVESIRNDSYRQPEVQYQVAQNEFRPDPQLQSLWQGTYQAMNIASSLPQINYTPNAMRNPLLGQGMLGMSPIGQMGSAGVNQYMYDPNVRELAESINSSFSFLPILNKRDRIKNILNSLANENPEKLAALELVYGQMYGEPDRLRKDLRKHSTGLNLGLFRIKSPFNKSSCEEIETLNTAAKVSPMNSAIALHEAMKGVGTDNKTVKDIIYNSHEQTLSHTMQYYKMITGGESLQSAIEGDFNSYLGGSEERLIGKLDGALIRAY